LSGKPIFHPSEMPRSLYECIGDFVRIENRSQLHPSLLVSIGSFFRDGTRQASPSPVAA
jgi:hypothetical protein